MDRAAKHDFFTKDFDLHIKETNIPLSRQLTMLPFGFLGLCVSGCITVDVYMHEYCVKKGDLIVILPNQLVSVKEKSEDFAISYFKVSPAFINEVVSAIFRLSPLFFIHMRRRHHYQLTDEEVYRFNEYYSLIESRNKIGESLYAKEYIINVLRLFYLDLYNSFNNKVLLACTKRNVAPDNRKEKLAHDFFLLILKYYKVNRDVAFYANELCITSKYLSTVIKEVSARSAKDWIIEYVMLEIKCLLRKSDYNIQEIAMMNNFPSQASLGKFFKKYAGISPSEYRTAKLLKNKCK